MAEALRLARRGLHTTRPNPRVGCLVVQGGEVVGRGWHERAGEPHAEIHALAEAGAAARGATVYVTLEPCSHHGRTPPCAEALVQAGVARVVCAMEDPNPRVAGAGLQRLRQAGIEVASGLMEAEAEALNPGFISRMRRGRPWLRVKMAMSLDGRTAMASGESQWITGDAARADVQQWRARSCAVLTGIGTVLHDDPGLNVRLPGAIPQPLRVVVDSRLRMEAEAKMLGLEGPVMLATLSDDPDKRAALLQKGVEVYPAQDLNGQIDLTALLGELAAREINEVHVEAGATLGGALLRAGLVDEILIYMAPTLLGDGARGLFRLPDLDQMAKQRKVRIEQIRAVGDDWRILARPVES